MDTSIMDQTSALDFLVSVASSDDASAAIRLSAAAACAPYLAARKKPVAASGEDTKEEEQLNKLLIDVLRVLKQKELVLLHDAIGRFDAAMGIELS